MEEEDLQVLIARHAAAAKAKSQEDEEPRGAGTATTRNPRRQEGAVGEATTIHKKLLTQAPFNLIGLFCGGYLQGGLRASKESKEHQTAVVYGWVSTSISEKVCHTPLTGFGHFGKPLS